MVTWSSEAMSMPHGRAAEAGPAYHAAVLDPDATSAVEVWSRALAAEDGGDEDLEALNGEERARAATFGSERARRSFVAGRAVLRRILAARLGLPPGDVRFERRCEHCGHPDHGRPRLADAGPGSLEFNLSHGAGQLVVAVGTGAIGVDVEGRGRRPVHPRVVQRATTPGEAAWLADLDPPERAVGFLRLWTRKEAVAKALGLGIVVPFRGFEVLGDGPIVARPGTPPLEVRTLEPSDGIAAVATRPGSELVMRSWPGAAAG